ncbi:hypothetical protein [Geomicrobium sediminis]|uniref:Uncharacterized protein n=1 Tax=Geomicrobium sediminis TaxID=1347788 RepID=A0ABS2PD40_9BACL|nr:hypothetical protein [Geomicrobium sediminis]MBM7633339.1 hypothetical protein [Geomicrobium sediminis]
MFTLRRIGERLYMSGMGLGAVAVGIAFFSMLEAPGTQAHWSLVIIILIAAGVSFSGLILQNNFKDEA